MLSQDLIVAPQGRPAALIEGSGCKARDRIEHFLRAGSTAGRSVRSLPFWKTASL